MQNPQLFSSHKKGVAPAIVFAGAAGPFIFYLLSAVTVTISVSVAAAVAVSVAAAAAVPVITSSAAAVRCPCCAAAAACIPGSIRIPVKIASASAAASGVRPDSSIHYKITSLHDPATEYRSAFAVYNMHRRQAV